MSAHRYWRIYVTSTPLNSYVGLRQIKMYETAGGSNLSLFPTYGSGDASSTNGTWSNECFKDESEANGWNSDPGQTLPQWVWFDFGAGSPKDIILLTLVGNTYTQYLPSTFIVQSSDDAVTWADLETFTFTAGDYGTQTFYFGPQGHADVDITAPPPVLTFNSGGSALLLSPTPILQWRLGATVTLQAPERVISSASGANISIAAPSPILTFQGHDSTGENAFSYTASSPTLIAYGGANTRFSATRPTLTTAATGTNWVSAAITAPTPTLTSTGTTSVIADTSLTAPSPNLIGYGGAVCSVTLNGKPTIQATGTTGVIGGSQITAPLFKLTASGTAQNHGSASLIAPAAQMGAQAQAWLVAPGAALTAIGQATITATHEAYALNLNHTPRPKGEAVNDEMTHFTNFPFTHVVRYQNSYFGANETGLYLLEGTTDDGAPIPWEVKTATTDFDSPQLKTIESVYFGGRMGPESTVSLTAGEKTPVTYDYVTPRGATAQNYRQPFGKGLKARYFAIGASGEGELTLDTLNLNVATLARKV